MTSLVPLRITSGENEADIVWAKPLSLSIQYCRMLRFQYENGISELIRAENFGIE